MTNRVELRDLMEAALKTAASLAADRVYTARTMPTQALEYPLILIQTGSEDKQGVSPNAKADFNTVSEIAATGRAEGTNDNEVLEKLDVLSIQIEKAILSDLQILKRINMIESVSTDIGLFGDKKMTYGDVQMRFRFAHTQIAEEFFPEPDAQALEGVDIHLDTKNPNDPTGTYPDPAFPESVTDAPRTSGPDGRDEATLKIDLPQT